MFIFRDQIWLLVAGLFSKFLRICEYYLNKFTPKINISKDALNHFDSFPCKSQSQKYQKCAIFLILHFHRQANAGGAKAPPRLRFKQLMLGWLESQERIISPYCQKQ